MSPQELRHIIDHAHFFGLLQKDPQGQLQHAPFSLTPYSLPQSTLQQLQTHTQWSSWLIWQVAQNQEFLREALEPIARVDEFVRFLLELMPKGQRHDHQLLFNRNDFLMEARANSGLQAWQVELNTISASFAHLSSSVSALHRQLQQEGQLAGESLEQNTTRKLAEAFQRTLQDLGKEEAGVLMLVQPQERNWFDQMGPHAELSRLGVPVIRATLTEIQERGTLRSGQLFFDQQPIGIVYFRAGYAPSDFPDGATQDARRLLEASSAVLLPEASMQLAGTKKVQQLLARPQILRQLIDEPIAQILEQNYAQMFSLEEAIDGISARAFLQENFENFVLKPQREGGGNNVYGADIPGFLSKLPPSEERAWIAMQRIQAEVQDSLLVVRNEAQRQPSISEVGIYGLFRARSGEILDNQPVGQLVRTKAANVNEGGVVAGFACLNSLLLDKPSP